MINGDWERFGDEIRRTVQHAVESQNFEKLNQTIKNSINNAVGSATKGVKSAGEAFERAGRVRTDGYRYRSSAQSGERFTQSQPYSYAPALYTQPTSTKVGAIIMTALGSTFGVGAFITCFVFLIVNLVKGGLGVGFQVGTIISGTIAFLCAMVAGGGISLLKKGGRFRKYIQAMGGKDYCEIKELAQRVGKSSKFVVKDVEQMIAKGWFSQGRLDKQRTCLMTSKQAYEQYTQLMEQAARNAQMQEQVKKQQTEQKLPGDIQKIIDSGDEYILKIHRCNDAIPGMEISRKISRMETLVGRIFERVEQNPESVDDIQKLMDYYLPTTVKLLEAYEQLDAQPVQGENILSSKREIEATLDTLNLAFEKLLDDLFQDTAWDVSADISVLHTVLAQEGLTGNDFADK